MSATALPIVGRFSALERCSDAVATFVEQYPTLSNMELHELSRLLLGALVRETQPDMASAMILSVLIAVRDAADAVRGDTRTITESRLPCA